MINHSALSHPRSLDAPLKPLPNDFIQHSAGSVSSDRQYSWPLSFKDLGFETCSDIFWSSRYTIRYFTVILKGVNGSERMLLGEQKLNTCFPVSSHNCTAPVRQYALRALLFSASFHSHTLYTFVCCEDNHRMGGYDFTDEDLSRKCSFRGNVIWKRASSIKVLGIHEGLGAFT